MSFMHRLFDSSLLQIFCDTSFIMTKSRKVFWDTVQSQVFFSGRKSRGFGEVVVSLIVTSIFCLHEPLFKTGKGFGILVITLISTEFFGHAINSPESIMKRSFCWGVMAAEYWSTLTPSFSYWCLMSILPKRV